MATIGLDKLYYAKITEGTNGDETYGSPIALAKAIKADLSVELAEATLYADDSAASVVKEFKSGKLSLGIDDIGVTAAQHLTGATIDENHCEGMVPMRDLGDDYYDFDEKNYCLIGRRHHKKFSLGDPVTIKVARANLEKKQLDFALVEK